MTAIMVPNMLDIIKIIKDMAKALTFRAMGMSYLENGFMISLSGGQQLSIKGKIFMSSLIMEQQQVLLKLCLRKMKLSKKNKKAMRLIYHRNNLEVIIISYSVDGFLPGEQGY